VKEHPHEYPRSFDRQTVEPLSCYIVVESRDICIRVTAKARPLDSTEARPKKKLPLSHARITCRSLVILVSTSQHSSNTLVDLSGISVTIRRLSSLFKTIHGCIELSVTLSTLLSREVSSPDIASLIDSARSSSHSQFLKAI
jgi:hypothetical protein